jgi:peptide/nickel transport system ATP-binding protein
VFHTRCHRFVPGTCDVVDPPTVELEPGHTVKCVLSADELRSTPVTLTTASS